MKGISIKLQYPSVQIKDICLSDARCLLEDYCGEESEFTSICTYLYQSYTLCNMPQYDELRQVLKGIAISEMHHHEMLGEIIVKLGGTPVFGGKDKFWNGSMVNYCKDIINMINIDIKAEQEAIKNYKKTICCVKNYEIRELIERIIRDEELHILTLEEQKIKLSHKN